MRKVIINSQGKALLYDSKFLAVQDGLPPADYVLLQYVSLKNQLIDTEEKSTNNSEIEAGIRVTSASSVATYLWYSDSNSSGSTNTTAYCSGAGNWRFGNRTFSIPNATYVGNMHTFIQNENGVWIDDDKINSYSSVPTFTSSANLQFGSSSANGKMDVSFFKHSKSGVLVSHYIPVRRISDNTAGFWDLIKEEFTAGGTAGPVAE